MKIYNEKGLFVLETENFNELEQFLKGLKEGERVTLKDMGTILGVYYKENTQIIFKVNE